MISHIGKVKTLIIILIIAAASVLLNGCGSAVFNSAENLVRPPKLSGDDGELQAAFEKAMSEKGEYILKYPSEGKYRSAFVRYDCDGDGSDEAFVFFSLKAEEMSVSMYMLDYENEMWKAVGEIPGEGNDIYSVEFCDLNNDGTAEILVGWSSLDVKTNKKLSVYCSYKNSQNLNYRLLAIETYTAMYTIDIDSDGEKEILAALINSTSDTYTTEARLLKMSSEKSMDFQIEAVGQISLYSEITAVTNISSCVLDGKTYAFIDETADNTYLTEMLYWDSAKNALAAPIKVDVLSVSTCPTSRSLPLNCDDIDGDGELEIPSTQLLSNSSIIRKMPEDSNKSNRTEGIPTENVYIVNWNKYDNGKFTVVKSYIENTYDKFRIDYIGKTMKDWCVSFYPDDHVSQFFELRSKASKDGKNETESVLLFSVNAFELDEEMRLGTDVFIGENYKYTYEITDEGKAAGITKSFIASVFSPSSDYK